MGRIIRLEPHSLALEGNGWKVSWANLGEGRSGDYDPKDPKDVNYLRFDVEYRRDDGEWETPPFDSSFCTMMPADTDAKTLVMALFKILVALVNEDAKLEGHRSYKVLLQKMSWIDPEFVRL